MTNPRSTVFKSGMDEGRLQTKAAVITFLQGELVDDKENRPERGTPEYEYGMGLTRRLMEHIDGVELQ